MCDVSYNTLASLRRHVKTSHGRYHLSIVFKCDACDSEFATIKATKLHQKGTHGTIAPNSTSNGAFPCLFCPLRFSSKISLSQHVRGKHMEEASQARAESATAGADGRRKIWDAVEIDRFKQALLLVGPNSNIEIAKIVGTRDNKQVGVFKRTFLAKNPNWLADNQPSAPSATIEQTADQSILNLNLNSNLPAVSSPSHHFNVSPHTTVTSSPPRHLNVSSNTTVTSSPPRHLNLSSHTTGTSSPFPQLNVTLPGELSDVISTSCTPLPSPQRTPSVTLTTPLASVNAGALVSCPRFQHTLSVTAQPFVPSSPNDHLSSVITSADPTAPSVPPPLPPAYSSPSIPTTDDNFDLNTTVWAPFYNEVQEFSGRQLTKAEWDGFCALLLCWADKLKSLVVSPQSRTSHPTTGWARRRNVRRRPPPPSLVPSNQPTTQPNPAPTNTPGTGRHHRRASGRQRDVAKARLLQRLYRANPSVAVRKILDDTPPTYCSIPEAELVTHFASTYAAPPPLDTPPSWLVSRPLRDDPLDAPFTPSEIQHQIRRAKKSAPGDDKLTYAHWKWIDPEGAILCAIFNICREAGRVPQDWKRSAVTLLPKGGDANVVRNWRPICLQKTIYKLYSGTLARRIADWAISSGATLPTQKGFLPYDGCAEHSFVLRSILNDSRRAKRNVLVAWLDLRDAFGSVSHELLLLIMSRLGLNGRIIDVVRDIYAGSTIAVKTGKDTYTADILQQ